MFVGVFAVYLERVHRPGNKAVLIHCIELPEFAKARRLISCYMVLLIAGAVHPHNVAGIYNLISQNHLSSPFLSSLFLPILSSHPDPFSLPFISLSLPSYDFGSSLFPSIRSFFEINIIM